MVGIRFIWLRIATGTWQWNVWLSKRLEISRWLAKLLWAYREWFSSVTFDEGYEGIWNGSAPSSVAAVSNVDTCLNIIISLHLIPARQGPCKQELVCQVWRDIGKFYWAQMHRIVISLEIPVVASGSLFRMCQVNRKVLFRGRNSVTLCFCCYRSFTFARLEMCKVKVCSAKEKRNLEWRMIFVRICVIEAADDRTWQSLVVVAPSSSVLHFFLSWVLKKWQTALVTYCVVPVSSVRQGRTRSFSVSLCSVIAR